MAEKGLVILIEDEEDLQDLYGMVINRAGFNVESILDGQEALDRLDKEPMPSVILLDIHLPIVSGDKILKAIRSNKKWASVPVYILTADVQIAQKFRRITSKISHPDGVIEKGSESILQLRKLLSTYVK